MKNQSLINKQIQEVLKDFEKPEESLLLKVFFNALLVPVFALGALGAIANSALIFVWAMICVASVIATRKLLEVKREKNYKLQLAEARLSFILSQANDKIIEDPSETNTTRKKSPPKNIRIEPVIDMNNLLPEDRLH